MTSTNFVLNSGSDQRITRSTTPFPTSTGSWTFYCKGKVVTYGDWGTFFGIIQNGTNFTHLAEFDAAGTLHIGRQGDVAPGYDEINIWTDSYTGWFDLVVICTTGTAQVYYRRDGGSWTTSVSRTMPTLAVAQMCIGFPDVFAPGVGTFRCAKAAVWTSALAEATAKAEGDARTLGTSTNCIFYNEFSGTAPNTDASGAGNNWTLVGSPTSNADDPWPAPGGALVTRKSLLGVGV